jgi:hypothetical protein
MPGKYLWVRNYKLLFREPQNEPVYINVVQKNMYVGGCDFRLLAVECRRPQICKVVARAQLSSKAH